jgi:hypothetical protein
MAPHKIPHTNPSYLNLLVPAAEEDRRGRSIDRGFGGSPPPPFSYSGGKLKIKERKEKKEREEKQADMD